MSYQATVVEILLAGPADVTEERQAIFEEIELWNQRHAHQVGIVMRAVTWETDTYPELGNDPQAVINRQLAGRCAAVIAVFATRLGTATPRSASGTAEEIDRFDVEGKLVSVYFSEGSGDLNLLDPAQLQALRDYKKSLKGRGTYRGYTSVADLRHLIDGQLAAWGYRFQAQQQAHEPQQVGATTVFDPTETDMSVIAAVGRMTVETGEGHINSLYLQEEPELSGVSTDDIFESLRVLKGLSLVMGDEDLVHGRWEVGLTSDGMEMWLLNFIRNYHQVQQQVATAIVKGNVRDPTQIVHETDVPRTIVDHVLGRWASRNLVILNRVYDETRVDRFSPEIQQLADESVDTAYIGAKAVWSDKTITQGTRYRTVARPIGVDVIALSDFGGELGDPVGAAVKVGGWTVVQVLAPSGRSAWEPPTEQRFRSEVRRLAAAHHLLDRKGEVRVVFDPPQSSSERRDETSGELVERG